MKLHGATYLFARLSNGSGAIHDQTYMNLCVLLMPWTLSSNLQQAAKQQSFFLSNTSCQFQHNTCKGYVLFNLLRLPYAEGYGCAYEEKLV